MNQVSTGEERCNPDGDPESVEIDRLLRTAAYYERLGCVNVAMALRALAQAKRQRGKGGGLTAA
ncbi:hypothetical protein [Shumkonia mesophila]|uniref:hypothetical protein n=1 Tax=Shumkonia mesophila TaxID=2838854 RepID=UPI00293417E9|nr:hypothetical protein [Shumkonia mesophila]